MLKTIDFWANVEDWSAIIITIIVIIIGLYRFRKITFPSQLLLFTIIVGFAANKTMDVFHARHMSDHVLLYINYLNDFIIGSMFFNYSIPQFRKIKLGIYMGAAGFVFWAMYSSFIAPMAFDAGNESYFYYASFFDLCCIVFSLIGLYLMFQESTFAEIRRNEVFWYFIIYIFGDGIGFIYDIVITMVRSETVFTIASILLEYLPNSLSVLFLGCLFLRYPKKADAVVGQLFITDARFKTECH